MKFQAKIYQNIFFERINLSKLFFLQGQIYQNQFYQNLFFQITKFIKAGANRTTFWPTFRPTSADQHVGPVCFEHEHVGEGKKEKCWPTFLKKLKNVGAVCGASQPVGQHGI